LALQNPVLLAIIGAAQGLKGEVRVKSYTQDPQGFANYGPLFDADGRTFEVLKTRPEKEVVITQFSGITDRNTAEVMNGVKLFVERSLLNKNPLDEDEFFHIDLIGLQVIDFEGKIYGKVIAVVNFNAGDILEISNDKAQSVSIPFSKAAVPDINFITGTLTIDPIAAGLIQTDEEQDEF
jgi:16S rRNA processing protein RimM